MPDARMFAAGAALQLLAISACNGQIVPKDPRSLADTDCATILRTPRLSADAALSQLEAIYLP